MDFKSKLIGLFSAMLVFLLIGPIAANATVETDWPSGTPNICQDPEDGFMDLELGIEASEIESTIPGLEFTTTYGLNWRYGDIRTGNYNVNPYGAGIYETNGDFFAWLGVSGDSGRITFTGGTASYLSLLVSTGSGVTIDAYDEDGALVGNSGWSNANTGTGSVTRLTVEADEMAYVEVHDTGNYWLIDDICTDAPPPCQPLPGRTLGDENERINLVFVPNQDYDGDMTDFLNDIDDRIDNRLGGHPPIDTNLDQFNFYYTELEGNVTGYPGGNCGELSSLPDDFLNRCPQADAVVVLHAAEFTDCNRFSGNVGVFSAEGGIDRSFIHEAGHGIFQLRDEYDSNRSSTPDCGYTSYDTGRALPSNIWETEEDCRADSEDQGWDPDQCYMFTPCQSDWWKLGDATLETDDEKYLDEDFQFIMKDGRDFSKGWGDAAARRINWVFDNISATPEASLPPPSGERAIILELNISDSGIVLLDKSFVIGPTPKYRPGEYSLTSQVLDSSGNMLGEYGFEDPRNALAEEGDPGAFQLDSANFTLKLPYFNRVGTSEIRDKTGAVLLAVDLSAFATDIDSDPYCGDGIVNDAPNEECDDGNTTSGDGCDSDCQSEPELCDVDGDGDIDRNDVGAIFAARNTSASGPDDPRDANGDGLITVNDGRECVLQCTNPRCAP